ncbi:MAG: TonB-dependent receptor [Fusobacteriota bacterium]
MKKVILVCMVLVGSILLGENGIDFGEVTVTAERFETTTRNVPKNISIITESEIQKSGASNLMEILETVPGVVVGDWTGSGKMGSIDLRGQGESAKNNVLVLVDGVSVNSIDMSGPEFSSIPVEEIARVEVLPGSGGVMYGDKAVAGVINIITKDIKKNGFSGFSKSESGSDWLFSYGGKLNYKRDKLTTSITYFDKYTDGHRENSYFDKKNYSLKLEYQILKDQNISFKYFKYEDNYGMPGPLSEEELEKNRTQSKNLEDNAQTSEENYQLQYTYNKNYLQLTNNFNYKYRKTKSNWVSYGDQSVIKNEKFTNNLKLKIDLNKLKVITGFNYLDGNSKKSDNNMEKKNLSGFVLNKFKLNEFTEIQGGYRKEFTKLIYNNIKTKNYNQDLFETSINYLYSKTGNIYMTIGNTYRTPVIDEYFEAGNPLWGVSDHYNENLRPQVSNNYEFGIKEYFLNTAIDVSFFKNKTKDEIYFNTKTYHNDNMESDIDRIGFEIKSDHYINPYINIKENYSYIRAEFESKNNEIKEVPGVPRHKYSAIIETNPLDNLKISGVFNFLGERYAISDTDNSLDKVSSYKTLDLKTDYKLDNFNIYSGIKNLLNEKYSSYIVGYGSYNFYPSSERNFYLGIKYNFK